MEPSPEKRIARLERLVAVLAVALVASLMISIFAIRKENPVPTEVLAARELHAGGLSISEDGFNSKSKVVDGRTAQAIVRTNQHNAFLALGVGKVGISIAAGDDGPVARIETEGEVESNLEIDTATGQWSVVQRRFDDNRKLLKEQRTTLCPALQ